MVKLIHRFKEISNQYKAIFCDLWGCLHDGQNSFPESLDALDRFRKQGGTVILLTNAPRPKKNVINFLNHLGITKKHFDDIITSGDATKSALLSGSFGKNVFHIGPNKNLCLFDTSSTLSTDTLEVDLVELQKASCIVCTGLKNDLIEKPSDYGSILAEGIKANLPMLCANPDIQVDYGEKRLWCAGALAAEYDKAGGKSVYFGKPYKPIYDLAIKNLQRFKPEIKASEILCIGDGIHTDIWGGINNKLPTLFVCGGLSRKETSLDGSALTPDIQKLKNFFSSEGVEPTASIWHLQ